MACVFPRAAYLCLIGWVLMNVAIFVFTYHKYLGPQHHHLYTMLGRGLCVSRASAAVINLNASLVLLPVCRGLNSLIYRALNTVSRTLLSLWLARLKDVHITLAVTIIIAAATHSVAHLVNSVNFSYHYDDSHKEINWAKYKGQSPVVIVLTSIVGLTGVAMLVILGLMLLMSLKCVRDRHYDLFWATHFLFLPFMGCLVLHPLSGVLKEQNNHVHLGSACVNGSALDSAANSQLQETNCPPVIKPTFIPMECQGWLWVVAALGVFTADYFVRLCRRNNFRAFIVSRVVNLPAGVTQLTLTCSRSFRFRPGQYVLLQCPRLSSLEWHPFTVISVSSSVVHTSITVLIRRRGDWTKAVCRMLYNAGNDRIKLNSYKSVRLLVDGPFCSPMENILKRRTVVGIAAGIGITPFIAVLEYLCKSDCVQQLKPSRLHLVWIVRTPDQLTWAADLITAVHHKFWYANQPDRFEVSFFVTRPVLKEDSQLDPLAQNLLEKRTHFGRPIWTDLFTEWASLYQKKEVSVFTCGPQSLSKQVKCTINKFNNRGGCHFTCFHEAFS